MPVLGPLRIAIRAGVVYEYFRPVRYRIVVNPVKTECLPLDRNGQRGGRIQLTGQEADLWWTRRATETGLHLHILLPTPLNPARPEPTTPRSDATTSSATAAPPPSPTRTPSPKRP